MANTLRIKRSASTNEPTSLLQGELANSESGSPNGLNEFWVGTTGPTVFKLIRNLNGAPAEPTAGLAAATPITSDYMVFEDASDSQGKRVLFSATPLSIFDDDLGYPSGTGTDNFITTWNGTGAIDADANSFLISNAVDKSATEVITGTWTLDGVVTTADFGTGGRVKDGTDVERPIGFNVMPVYEVDADDAFDLAHNGMMWHRDAGTAVNFTCNSDTNIPVGATYCVFNEGTDSIEITAGTASVLFLASGAAPVSGSVTVEQGGIVTVYKYADAEFWVWGDADPLVSVQSVTATASAGITVAGTATNPTVGIDYLGTDNLIDVATDLEGTAISLSDTIIYHDATDTNVKKGLVSDLPFGAGGAMTYQGGYNAATNTPDLDVAPSGVTKGDTYTVTAAGNFFTEAVEIGDVLIAEIDSAAALADWTTVQNNIGPASETVAGYIEIADQSEVDAEASAVLAVVPAYLHETTFDGGTF